VIPSTHIAIVGGSGSGKTWLAEKLCAELGTQAACLSLDDFYRDLSHLGIAARDKVNFDDPAAIDWASVRSVADALARGEMAQVPIYDFTTHTRCLETHRFAPREIVIWDGLWLLHENTMRMRFAWSVFVDCHQSIRLSRRVERDVRKRGRTEESVRLQCLNHVQPMHERFVEPQRDFANQVLPSPATGAQVVGLKEELLELIRRQDTPSTLS
jgi:uridine kinase